MFSIYHFLWDQVGSDFNEWVPGYLRRWAIIGDNTKISSFTELKLTQITRSSNLLYFLKRTPYIHKPVVDKQAKMESHDRSGKH